MEDQNINSFPRTSRQAFSVHIKADTVQAVNQFWLHFAHIVLTAKLDRFNISQLNTVVVSTCNPTLQ